MLDLTILTRAILECTDYEAFRSAVIEAVLSAPTATAVAVAAKVIAVPDASNFTVNGELLPPVITPVVAGLLADMGAGAVRERIRRGDWPGTQAGKIYRVESAHVIRYLVARGVTERHVQLPRRECTVCERQFTPTLTHPLAGQCPECFAAGNQERGKRASARMTTSPSDTTLDDRAQRALNMITSRVNHELRGGK